LQFEAARSALAGVSGIHADVLQSDAELRDVASCLTTELALAQAETTPALAETGGSGFQEWRERLMVRRLIERGDIDKAYVRSMRTLLDSDADPMLATHDPRLIEIGQALALRSGRAKDTFEFQMLLGVRPDEQIRLAELGHKVRVYVPYGEEWYPYLMRRMAEKPANLSLFLRSLVSKG
jgi:hypothetical protein